MVELLDFCRDPERSVPEGLERQAQAALASSAHRPRTRAELTQLGLEVAAGVRAHRHGAGRRFNQALARGARNESGDLFGSGSASLPERRPGLFPCWGPDAAELGFSDRR